MWLLRAGASSVNPLSKQGREDNFPEDQDPPEQPWMQWGAGSPATISGGRLHLDYNMPPGWFQATPDGGWNNEFQPLTPNWEYQFWVDLSEVSTSGSSSQDEGLEMFIGPGWTSNLVPSNQRFTLCVKFGHWTSGSSDNRQHHFGVRLQFRDSEAWIFDPGTSATKQFTISSAQIMTDHHFKIRMIADHIIMVDMDGANIMIWDIANTGDWVNYRTGPNKRSLAFRNDQAKSDIWQWKSKDYNRNPLTRTMTEEFNDPFTRANSNTIGNGWVASGANMGIQSNSLGIRQVIPSPADGDRGAYQGTPVSNGNMYVGAMFGGGGNIDASRPTTLLARMKSDGTGPMVGARIISGNVKIGQVDGNPDNPTFVSTLANVNDSFSNGTNYFLLVKDNVAWVEDTNGSCMAYCEGIDSFAPPSQRYYGAIFNRSTFVNSGYINTYYAGILT